MTIQTKSYHVLVDVFMVHEFSGKLFLVSNQVRQSPQRHFHTVEVFVGENFPYFDEVSQLENILDHFCIICIEEVSNQYYSL